MSAWKVQMTAILMPSARTPQSLTTAFASQAIREMASIARVSSSHITLLFAHQSKDENVIRTSMDLSINTKVLKQKQHNSDRTD